MNGKVFGLYSLENAVFFGVKQYVHFGESVFFSALTYSTYERQNFLIYEEHHLSNGNTVYLAVKKNLYRN